MIRIECIPVYLYPEQRLSFNQCKVVPGILLLRLTGILKQTIDDQRLPQLGFRATHVVCIDVDEYFRLLKDRLAREGKQIPADGIPASLDAESLAKQVLLTLTLIGPVKFAFRGIYTLERNATSKKPLYRLAAWANRPLQEVSTLMAAALPWGVTQRISARHIAQTAMKLDRYFRSGIWWSDRLAMGLKHLWNGLCSPIPEQAFLDLTIALEALLSTRSEEITHILAERVSVLLRRNSSDGLSLYRTMKHLYKTRSKIVHGKVFPKKGTQNWESLFITAKRSNVPISELKLLTNITISVVNAVLRQEELLRIIQTTKSEDKTNQDLDDFFVKLLLGS
jgi:hypothetical protein